MIHFNELRYSKDNKYLIVDVAIDSQDWYTDVILDSIIIDNQDTFISNGPSSTPIYTYNVEESYKKVYSTPEECGCNPVKVEDESYCFVDGLDSMKHIRLEIPLSVYGISSCNDMLFVYVIATGTPAADTPCGFDNSRIMGTVVDLQCIYNNALTFVRQIEDSCEIPKGFIDFILKFKALELYVKTGNYPLAIKHWNKYLSNMKANVTVTKSCGCYG